MHFSALEIEIDVLQRRDVAIVFADASRSPVHSACVGAEVEVHYRWHALYGRRLRLHYSEVRDGTRLSFVEADPGVVIVMPSWMLDPAACAATTLGAPQVDCAALEDLSRLLIDRGFRRSSSGEVGVAEEEPNEAPARHGRSKAETEVPRQLVVAFETPQLWMMQPPERQRIVSSLANLLRQAAGDDPLEEDGDDGR
jgi:hypothetical protein